jgi:WD40 repeat protein
MSKSRVTHHNLEAIVSKDNSIHIIDISEQKEDYFNAVHTKTLNGHTLPVTSVSFSSDSKYLVSGSYDKTVRIWETE